MEIAYELRKGELVGSWPILDNRLLEIYKNVQALILPTANDQLQTK